VSGCIDTDDQTTLAFASLDDDGRASYDFYVDGTADWGWTPAELATLPADTQVFHTGSLATTLSPGADIVLDRMERLHAAGGVLLSYDPNVRPALAGPREEAVRRVERFVAAAHVVKASDEDLAWLYPDTDPVDVVRRWSVQGPRLVVTTRGPQGCLAVNRSGVTVTRASARVEVVDTIGAGDSFESGLLSGLVDTGATAPERVDALSEADIGGVLDRAVLTSAMTCQRAGADPPTRAEYDARRSAG
jgi:fructokinase